MAKERYIPDRTRRQVLIEAGYRCGVPTCRGILAIDIHHIVEVRENGGSEPSNLIAICPTCHALFHRGVYSREAIYAWKQVLISLSFAFDLETVDLMLFLHHMRDEERFLIKPDAILPFARLIGNGLASLEWQQSVVSDALYSGYRVGLSARGQLLIEAWLAGDREAVKDALVFSQNRSSRD